MRVRHGLAAVAAAAAGVAAVAFPAAAQGPVALRVCTTGDYPPYSVTDGYGGYRGIDIELSRGLAGFLQRPAVFVPTTWVTLKTDFALRDCDIAVGGISDTPARRTFSDLSIRYGTDGKTPITRAGDATRYATTDQIDRPGVRVIVNPGGTNEDFARKNFPRATLIVWPDNQTICDQIDRGRADVFVTDSVEGRYRVRTHPGLTVLHPDRTFDSSGKVFLLRKNDPLLSAEVNGWLAAQLSDGGVDRLFGEWIGPRATA